MSRDTTLPDLVLRQHFSLGARVCVAALGGALFALPLKLLSRVPWPADWATIFDAVIAGGAATIGGALIVAAVIGGDVTWTIGNRQICRTWTSGLWRRTRILAADALAHAAVRLRISEARPPTYSIVLTPCTGSPFETPDFSTRAEAEALLADIMRRMRTPPTV